MKSKRIYDFTAKYRLWITRAIALVCAIEFAVYGIPRFLSQEHATLFYLVGSILILTGALIRSWAAGVLHKKKTVTCTGPYSLCRNPLYFGSGLVAIGFGFFLNDPWYWLGFIAIAIFIYPVTIRNEEINMRNRHQEEWDQYTERVGAFFPKKLSRDDIQADWSVKLWASNREYSTFALSILTLISLLVWIHIHQ